MTPPAAPTGLVTLPSRHGPAETAERLVAAVSARGMAVFARIDHAAAARAAGLELRATEVVVFGDPGVGTALMQAAQTMGLDLPLRALVWEDASATTMVSFEDPAAVAARHGIGDMVVLAKLRAALDAVARAATG